ncbi:MAG: hypothetical protein ACPGJV_09630 [Bacteriovoracaceae bacterium]
MKEFTYFYNVTLPETSYIENRSNEVFIDIMNRASSRLENYLIRKGIEYDKVLISSYLLIIPKEIDSEAKCFIDNIQDLFDLFKAFVEEEASSIQVPINIQAANA